MSARDRVLPEAISQALHHRELHLLVSSGIGVGPTKLAAFDAALREAGVANYNLLHLSSVIPPGSTLAVLEPESHDRIGPGLEVTAEEHGEHQQFGTWGDRLYVVMAEIRVERPHEEAWAAVGWVQERSTGKGLFVEHVGHSETQVRSDVEASLESLTKGRPDVDFAAPAALVRGTVCIDEPTCALVIAAFEAEPWRGEDVITLP